jgi:hypothetical protein
MELQQISTDVRQLSVEDIVAEWLLRYASLSNVDVAHLSNVSRRWRQASKRAIFEQTTKPSDRFGITLLLLPSMVRYIMSSAKDRVESDNNNVGVTDTFCAAWFHPDGIQELPISLNGSASIISASDDDYSHTTSKSINAFSPNGEPIYDASDKDDDDNNTKGDGTRSSRSSRKQQIRQVQNRSKSPATLSLSIHRNVVLTNGTATTGSLSTDEPRIATCNEWHGYRTAMEVLSHFGYQASFVNDVIASAQSYSISLSSLHISNEASANIETHGSRRNLAVKRRKYRETTYAVRGAIVSRPESYCDCIDTEIEQLRALRFATAGNDKNELNNIRIHEYKQSILRKEIRRLELQRDVLPRIITRLTTTPNGSINSAGKAVQNGVHEQKQEPQRHRCVQFLNANGGHAVCMLTPRFACGPLIEPVTIFCVGIATEDGCFLSGLHHRFELGHMYPNSELAEVSELSPVCIATDSWSAKVSNEATIEPNSAIIDIVDDNPASYPVIHICEDDDDDRDGEEDDDDDDDNNGNNDKLRIRDIVIRDDDDDDDSCDASCVDDDENRRRKCNCIFNGVGEKIAALDEDKPRVIHRGRLGPGTWHCYVAVFDGENSMIRIDGVSESMQTERPDSENDTTAQNTNAMLDGLTIGSDHCFGMSLCCGNGSGGEGEGAIAELAVFQGRLDLTDVKVLEKNWMERHCIPPVLPSQTGMVVSTQQETTESDAANMASITLWNEDDLARQAHALFFLPETEDGTTSLPSLTPTSIPLRFLSRHRSVAWKQTNPVTGELIHIKRIGCKPGASSSDL